MILQDVFDQLTYGELSQMSIGGFDNGGICEGDKTAIISHIQLGLTSLYKRFKLLENEVTITLIADKTSYTLHSDFLLPDGNTASASNYLTEGEGQLFDDRMFKVEQVRDDLGYPVVLNKRNEPNSVYTPTLKTLIVPSTITSTDYRNPVVPSLDVRYRTNHPVIDANDGVFSSGSEVLLLPDSHLEALLNFVASRVMNPTGMTNEFHAGNSYYAKYEAECQRLEQQNLQIDDVEDDIQFQTMGFV